MRQIYNYEFEVARRTKVTNWLISSIFILLIIILLFPLAKADNMCINCHQTLSAFNETEQQFNQIRLEHLARDIPCSLECHTSTLSKFAKSDYEQWTKSKHALFDITCDKCHGGDPNSSNKDKAHVGILRSSDPNSTIFYRNVPETCGKCHTEQLKNFMNSIHYQRLKALQQAPSCDTCHIPHEFQILNISDFHDLCSQCHNLDTRIAPSDAPDKAITALQNADKLKSEIKDVQITINQAKAQGKDVSDAQKDLDAASAIKDSLPELWHSFNLPKFEGVISDGTKLAQKAAQETGLPVTTPPKTPGFEGIITLSVIFAIYIISKR